jgi:membrane protease YdiL (CAAX protease family)
VLEPRDPRSVSPLAAVTLAVVAVALTYVLFQGSVALQSLARGVSWELARARVMRDALGLALVQAAAFALVLFGAVRLHARDDEPLRETLGLRPLSFPIALLALLAGAALQLPLSELSNLVRAVAPVPMELLESQQRLLAASSPFVAFAAFVSFVVVAPVTEELLFRGIILRGVRVPDRTLLALGLSSGLFALSHIGAVSALAYALVAGLVLGAVALRTGSTVASIALHAGVNAVPVLLPARLVQIPGFNTLAPHVSPALVIGSALVAAVALGLLSRFAPSADDGTD